MEYILEVKQIVDYPRVRIYREFIQNLINYKELSIKGNCNLFNYIVLCCYANYSTSRKRIDGKQYFIAPGQWLCSIKDLMKWFSQTKVKTLEVLDSLQKMGVIEYEIIKEYVFYKIIEWDKYNSYMEYEAHCSKDDGFFFFPFEYIDKFLEQNEKCSEKDILMDLWLNTIYNDNRVDGSKVGPVVYFRNGTGNPRTSYSFLAKRWKSSKATVCRLLEKLQEKGYIIEKEFIKTFEELKYSRNSYSIWSDFVTICACSISNIVDKRYFDEREEMYLKIIKKYNKDEQELFAKLMAKTFIALTNNPQQDFLGKIFMSLNLGSASNGQFFTPYHICEFMAKMTIDAENVKQTLKDTGSFSVCDPTCGSGALLIAAVNEISAVLKDEQSFNLGKIVKSRYYS